MGLFGEKERNNRRIVKAFKLGMDMHGRLVATESRRIKGMLTAAAEESGVGSVDELDLVFYTSARKRGYLYAGPDNLLIDKEYLFGRIINVFVRDDILSVVTKHKEKAYETRFRIVDGMERVNGFLRCRRFWRIRSACKSLWSMINNWGRFERHRVRA